MLPGSSRCPRDSGNEVMGQGTSEAAGSGFGFLCLARFQLSGRPDEITSRPIKSQVRPATRSRARSAPKGRASVIQLVRVSQVNFDDPDAVRHRVTF